MIKTSGALFNAWSLLETKGWCRNELAVNASGEATMPEDDDACAFCSIGALEHGAVKSSMPRKRPQAKLEKAAASLGYRLVSRLNDRARPKTVEEMWMLATLLALADEEAEQ